MYVKKLDKIMALAFKAYSIFSLVRQIKTKYLLTIFTPLKIIIKDQ